MNYKQLKDKIKEILSDSPADYYDEQRGLLFQTDTWELAEDREYIEEEDIKDEYMEEWDPRAVGSANMIVASTLIKKALHENANILSELKRISSNNTLYVAEDSVEDLFQLIMSDLEEEKIIRKKPELIRKNFKIVGGKDVGIDNPN